MHLELVTDLSRPHSFAAHASFDVALSQFAHSLARADHIAAVTASEVSSYRLEAANLSTTADDTSSALGDLGDQLARAQRERARRIEYDALARVIQRLPDRHKGLECVHLSLHFLPSSASPRLTPLPRTSPPARRQQQRLESDIALLESESRTYAETWQARKVAFDAIVDGLQVMQEAIRCVAPPRRSLAPSQPCTSSRLTLLVPRAPTGTRRPSRSVAEPSTRTTPTPTPPQMQMETRWSTTAHPHLHQHPHLQGSPSILEPKSSSLARPAPRALAT